MQANGFQDLFQSVGRDGAEWLFVVGFDGGWAIIRNGKEVSLGTGNQASVDAGVRRFMSLTRHAVGSDVACDPIVGPLIDRIEREGSAAAKVAKDQPRSAPHDSRKPAACLTIYGIANP